MITREEILKYTENFPAASYDYPFEGDFFTAVLRNGKSKWFGILMRAPENYFKSVGAEIPENREILNVKCPTDLSPFLKARYKGILPAYHMNKKHWLTVVLQSDIPAGDVFKLLELSYDLTTVKK